MLVAIHQLHYLPWLRYIHKIASCDVFVVLDNIQFNKNGWQNRNKIKTAEGSQILTVPVFHKNAQNLDEVLIDSKSPWQRKHWNALNNNYRRAPYFKEYAETLQKIYEQPWEKLNDLNYAIFGHLISALRIKTKILRGSDLALKGEATDRLIAICKDLGANAYLTGAYAAETYLDSSFFEREGIELVMQTYESPTYPQLFPKEGFIPELSIVDLLFNCGSKSLDVLLQGHPHDVNTP